MTSIAEILNGRELEAELQDVRFNGRAPEHPPVFLRD